MKMDNKLKPGFGFGGNFVLSDSSRSTHNGGSSPAITDKFQRLKISEGISVERTTSVNNRPVSSINKVLYHCSLCGSRETFNQSLVTTQRRVQSAPTRRNKICSKCGKSQELSKNRMMVPRLEETLSWTDAMLHIRRWADEENKKIEDPQNSSQIASAVFGSGDGKLLKKRVCFNLTEGKKKGPEKEDKLRNHATSSKNDSKNVNIQEESNQNVRCKLDMATAASIVAKTSNQRLLNKRKTTGIRRFSRIAREGMDSKQLKTLRKFRSVLQSVKLVCAVSIRMRDQSKEAAKRSGVTSLFCQDGNESYHLFFDKWEFSRANSHKLSLAARIAASRPPQLRSQADIDRIYSVLKNLMYFKDKFSDEKKKQLCKVAWYMTLEKGRVVVRQGHPGNHFYLIYSGSVAVQVTNGDPDDDVSTNPPEITQYGPGCTFGEVALLEEEGTRTATVVCNETTELFQIDRTDFLSVCCDVFQDELSLKVKAARGVKLFDSWENDKLVELCKKGVIRNLAYGHVVERDWRSVQHLYLILKGKLEMLIKVKARSQSPYSQSLEAKKSFIEDILDQMEEVNSPETTSCHERENRLHREGYMSVGLCHIGDISDARVLLAERRREVRPVILTSLGATVLRFSVHLLKELAPQNSIQEFIDLHFTPPRIPDTDELEQAFLSNIKWNKLRGQIGQTLLWQKQHNSALAFIPASQKAF